MVTKSQIKNKLIRNFNNKADEIFTVSFPIVYNNNSVKGYYTVFTDKITGKITIDYRFMTIDEVIKYLEEN